MRIERVSKASGEIVDALGTFPGEEAKRLCERLGFARRETSVYRKEPAESSD